MVAADVTGCAKAPKWRFGRTKKGFSDPSPPKKTRHIETVEVVFPGSPAGEEFSHSLVRRRTNMRFNQEIRLLTSAATPRTCASLRTCPSQNPPLPAVSLFHRHARLIQTAIH